MVSNFKTRLVKIEKISLSLILFVFELDEPKEIEFKSGQYVAITLPDGKSLRSYSISSSELKKTVIELTINIFDRSLGGAGVDYFSSLKIDDIVTFKGPFGRLNLVDSKIIVDGNFNHDVTEIIWFGTGSGIAPLKSMLEYINSLSCGDNCVDDHLKNIKNAMYIGGRFSGDICYFDEMSQVKNVNPNFKFAYCLSKLGTDEDQGEIKIPQEYIFKGHVTEKILQDTADYHIRSHIHVFACGKTATIQDILNKLAENGFDRSKFHVENYG